MKFNNNVIRTYGAVVVLLLLLTVIVSYQTNTVPVATLVAVPVAVAFNFCITRGYFKSRSKFPFSAIITSMIVTLVIPQSTSLLIVICAVTLAELSKSFIKLKSKNIFNPAAIGLVFLAVFGVNPAPFSWVNANSVYLLYLSLPLLLLVGLAIYSVKRAPISLSFGITFLFLSIISLGLVKGFSITWMSILLLSGYYSIAFVMLSDPKTSPKETWVQCVYGCGTAFLTFIFSIIGLSFAFPISLLLGNLTYAVHKPIKKK